MYELRGESFAFLATSGVVKRRIVNFHFSFSPKTHQLRMPTASEEYPIYSEVDGTLWGKKQSRRPSSRLRLKWIAYKQPKTQQVRCTYKHAYLCYAIFRWVPAGPYVRTTEGKLTLTADLWYTPTLARSVYNEFASRITCLEGHPHSSRCTFHQPWSCSRCTFASINFDDAGWSLQVVMHG